MLGSIFCKTRQSECCKNLVRKRDIYNRSIWLFKYNLVAITTTDGFKCVIMRYAVNVQIFIVIITVEVFKISDFLKVV